MCDALREICRELMADEIEQKVEMGLEEGRAQGIAQGVEQGVVQGRAETLRQVADSLRNMGFTIEKIAEALKVDAETASNLITSR